MSYDRDSGGQRRSHLSTCCWLLRAATSFLVNFTVELHVDMSSDLTDQCTLKSDSSLNSISASLTIHSHVPVYQSWDIDQIMVGDGEEVRVKAVSGVGGNTRRNRDNSIRSVTFADSAIYCARGYRGIGNPQNFWAAQESSVTIGDIEESRIVHNTVDSIASGSVEQISFKTKALTAKAQNTPAQNVDAVTIRDNPVGGTKIFVDLPTDRQKKPHSIRTRSGKGKLTCTAIRKGSGQYVKEKLLSWLKANKGWAAVISGPGSRRSARTSPVLEAKLTKHQKKMLGDIFGPVDSEEGVFWGGLSVRGTRSCVPVSVIISYLIVVHRCGHQCDKEAVVKSVMTRYSTGGSLSSLAETVDSLKTFSGGHRIRMTRVEELVRYRFISMLGQSEHCPLHRTVSNPARAGLNCAQWGSPFSREKVPCSCPNWNNINEGGKDEGVFLVRFFSKKADHVVAVDVKEALVFDSEEQHPLTLCASSLGFCSGLGSDVSAGTLGIHIRELRKIREIY